MAQSLAQAGSDIVIADLDLETAKQTADWLTSEGGRTLAVRVDVTDPADVDKMTDEILSKLGRIDVLFNNAAMAYFNLIEDISDEEWATDRRNEVDLVFYLTRAAWPQLKKNHGVIVNMASLNASLSFKLLPSLAHSTFKAGIIAMTRQLAVEGREYGIRANSISPGVIETNQTREQLKDPEWAGSMLGKTLLEGLGGSERGSLSGF